MELLAINETKKRTAVFCCQLESRMHRMERRMAMKKRRSLTDSIDTIPEDHELKPAAPKK